MRRLVFPPALFLLLSGCGSAAIITDAGTDAPEVDAGRDAGPPDNADGGDPTGVTLSGDALPFSGGSDARIAHAVVTVLERPELRVTTDTVGHFEFDGLTVGSEVTLRMAHRTYVDMQIGTITLGASGASRVTFQAVTPPIYTALASVAMVTPDPALCQLVTTVTRIGRSVYDPGAHGEAGVVVTITPPPTSGEGPIYFNASVLPDRTLTMTSDDGGVLYANLPPGRYTLTATKAGATFTTVTAKCEAGWIVNASPPWGLQRTM